MSLELWKGVPKATVIGKVEFTEEERKEHKKASKEFIVEFFKEKSLSEETKSLKDEEKFKNK